MPEPDPSFSEPKTVLPPGTGWLLSATAVIGLTTLAGLLTPFNFRAPAGGSWLALTYTGPVGIVAMIGLFVPFGFVEGWLAHNIVRFRNWPVLLVLLDAASLSLTAETAQMWLPSRESSLVDLVANSFGATAGALIGDAFAPALSLRLWRH